MIAGIHQTGATVTVDGGRQTPAHADRWREPAPDTALGRLLPVRARRTSASHIDSASTIDADRSPARTNPNRTRSTDTFAAWTAEQGLTLYPAQFGGVESRSCPAATVILGNADRLGAEPGRDRLPTSRRWLQGRRTVLTTAPIKALVSEKFFSRCATPSGRPTWA